MSAGFARFWQAALQLLITPLVAHLLGPTAYGLVGLYGTIYLLVVFLEQTVNTVLSRELARSADRPDSAKSLRCLLRTLEFLAGAMAIVLGGTLALGAPWIAHFWLAHSGLPDAELISSIRLMGLGLACQWPTSLYAGGFFGLQRQVPLAGVRICVSTVQSLGAVLLLAKVSATPQMFFIWMAVTSGAMSCTLGIMLWRIMPGDDEPPRIDLRILRSVWRFGAGNLTIGMTGALLTQAGSLIVAKFCAMDQLAAYALALNLASQVSTILSQPISGTLMPHFANLMARGHEARLSREYHRWTQAIVMMVLPVAGTLMVFPRPLLQFWLGSSSPLVAPVAELLPWITMGTLINTLMTPPYFLQIAHGWTRLTVIKNLIALAIVLPALTIGVPRYGPIAAAVCWIGINLGYYLLEVPFMHRRLLPREIWAWWGRDTLLPTAVVAGIYAATALLLPADLRRLTALFIAAGVAALAWIVLFAALPLVRADIIGVARRLNSRLFGTG